MEGRGAELLGPAVQNPRLAEAAVRLRACAHELITFGCILQRPLLASERQARELKEKAQDAISGKGAAEAGLCSQD